MNRRLIPVLVMAALILALVTAGCSQNRPGDTAPAIVNTTAVPVEEYTSNATLVAFVERAAAYANASGTKKALAEFNNPNGSFMEGELYIYAYAFNGTTLAHPVNPEEVGKVREGAIGVFVQEMGGEVRNGSGFYRFTYINPQHDRRLESKLGYGIKIDDEWWLGSGIYTGPVEPSATPAGTVSPSGDTLTSNETLVAFVDSAVDFAEEHGKEAALAEFNDPNGSFVRGELYIYAYDFNDTVLAHPFSPEKIGMTRMDEPDPYGNLYSYRFIDTARNGSGFVRYYYLNPVHNGTIESKLGYVRKVDESWWLGSGVYTGPAGPVLSATGAAGSSR